jgi:hypothetical protein
MPNVPFTNQDEWEEEVIVSLYIYRPLYKATKIELHK